MNPNTPPPSDDDLPDERELAALYARLPKEEPGSALDAAIQARAAQAVSARRHRRWPAAVASAAVLVLAVGLAWQLRDTRPKTATAPAAIQERKPAPAAAPAPPPIEMPLLAPGVTNDASRHAEASAKKVVPGRVLTHVMSAAPMPAPVPSAPAEPRAAPAPPVPPSPPSPLAPEAPRAMAPFSEGTPSSLAPRRLDLSPDDRVGEIRRLLDRGQRAEALRRLHDLRLRYPRYDIPQDLRDLDP